MKALAALIIVGAGGAAAWQVVRSKGSITTTTTTTPQAPQAQQAPTHQGGSWQPAAAPENWLSGFTQSLSNLFDWGNNVNDNNKPEATGAPVVQFPAPVLHTPQQGAGVDYDTLTLARTLYGEANREKYQGKQAVASVILNRVRSRRWPNSVASVCLQPWQFSCWNASDPMRARIENLQPNQGNALFEDCLIVARRATAGQLPDNTGGATHYYANYIAQPRWIAASPNARKTAEYGVHMFYAGIA
ncbi:cell wall hydrolase [Polycladidibacter hongkongensis]|uniref:cell wall hydrolase n=1 Tax=Polycladidibacter hongkongensis TaxID=1647556 RepID=UPI00082988BE|nr:cell wall hydrolase [Pseudovibrio hongkongensis]